MTDLVKFLTARYDEDEQAALAAGEARIAWLTYRDDQGHMLYTTVAAEAADGVWITAGAEAPEPTSVRVVYDPARERRDVEAKRKLMARHTACDDTSFGEPCEDLCLLALPYADDPGYKETWRP